MKTFLNTGTASSGELKKFLRFQRRLKIQVANRIEQNVAIKYYLPYSRVIVAKKKKEKFKSMASWMCYFGSF